ncbi:MAG: biotin--[acetyl-CoA-carboxylase] ligase [Alphaproteobacteria bacterium]|nr:biotin--[acetyl-CoA-carboxylase] ligase [Alphaproteobacteria bacterium]
MKYDDWHILRFEELASTNDEAQKYCRKPGYLTAVKAKRQTAGRGRLGRKWLSYEGNLFCSLVLEFELQALGQLVLVSALSVLETVKELAPAANVQLKWPNDVLLNGAKVCGMLLEKGAGDYMIVGIGVNIVKAPDRAETLYPATALADCGIRTTADAFLERCLHKLTENMQILEREGIAPLRRKWLNNAKNVGKEITVRQDNREIKGIFAGLDDSGNLLLQQENAIKTILAGDVFYDEK